MAIEDPSRPSRSAQLTRDSMPAKCGAVRRLSERVDELEKRIALLEKGGGMDPITTAIILSWVEIKSVCQGLVKHPDSEDERIVAEHILSIMDRHIREARAAR